MKEKLDIYTKDSLQAKEEHFVHILLQKICQTDHNDSFTALHFIFVSPLNLKQVIFVCSFFSKFTDQNGQGAWHLGSTEQVTGVIPFKKCHDKAEKSNHI